MNPVPRLMNDAEMGFVELRGQMMENGKGHHLTAEAVRALRESVALLAETILGESPCEYCLPGGCSPDCSAEFDKLNTYVTRTREVIGQEAVLLHANGVQYVGFDAAAYGLLDWLTTDVSALTEKIGRDLYPDPIHPPAGIEAALVERGHHV